MEENEAKPKFNWVPVMPDALCNATERLLYDIERQLETMKDYADPDENGPRRDEFDALVAASKAIEAALHLLRIR